MTASNTPSIEQIKCFCTFYPPIYPWKILGVLPHYNNICLPHKKQAICIIKATFSFIYCLLVLYTVLIHTIFSYRIKIKQQMPETKCIDNSDTPTFT